MLRERENFRVVDARAFENAAPIMQGVRQHMDLRIPPRHKRPIHPNETVSLVIRNGGHSHLQCLFLLLVI